jgi:hypothetical protein
MRPILLLLGFVFMAGCTKDKFTTNPQLKIKSINSTDISGTQTLQITLTLTDKEGDFSTFFFVKKTVASCPASNFTDSSGKFAIPQSFIDTKEKQGDVIVTFDKLNRGGNACAASGGGAKIDTAVFSFWTRDLAGNKSDSVTTKPIIIRN